MGGSPAPGAGHGSPSASVSSFSSRITPWCSRAFYFECEARFALAKGERGEFARLDRRSGDGGELVEDGRAAGTPGP